MVLWYPYFNNVTNSNLCIFKYHYQNIHFKMLTIKVLISKFVYNNMKILPYQYENTKMKVSILNYQISTNFKETI